MNKAEIMLSVVNHLDTILKDVTIVNKTSKTRSKRGRPKKKWMKKLLSIIVLLISLVSTSCTKDNVLICGIVNGGGYEAYTNTYYLRVDSKKYWVDFKTYESYFIGDDICLEDY